MKKIIIYGVLLFLTYKGLDTYYTASHKDIILSCENFQEMERMKATATEEEKRLYLREFWQCVEKKQSFMQKLFYEVPIY